MVEATDKDVGAEHLAESMYTDGGYFHASWGFKACLPLRTSLFVCECVRPDPVAWPHHTSYINTTRWPQHNALTSTPALHIPPTLLSSVSYLRKV